MGPFMVEQVVLCLRSKSYRGLLGSLFDAAYCMLLSRAPMARFAITQRLRSPLLIT